MVVDRFWASSSSSACRRPGKPHWVTPLVAVKRSWPNAVNSGTVDDDSEIDKRLATTQAKLAERQVALPLRLAWVVAAFIPFEDVIWWDSGLELDQGGQSQSGRIVAFTSYAIFVLDCAGLQLHSRETPKAELEIIGMDRVESWFMSNASWERYGRVEPHSIQLRLGNHEPLQLPLSRNSDGDLLAILPRLIAATFGDTNALD